MARLIDQAAGDAIDYGSDASIDDFSIRSTFMWLRTSHAAGAQGLVLEKGAAWTLVTERAVVGETNGHVQVTQDFTVTDGDWVTANETVTDGTDLPIGAVYNRGSSANDPTVYISGASSAVAELTPPVGSSNGDAASIMESSSGVNQQRIGWLVYDDVAFTAADANRHRWWGRAPGGPSTMSVWHPMWTEATANKGTATANMSLTGTSVVSIPKVMRPGCGGF